MLVRSYDQSALIHKSKLAGVVQRRRGATAGRRHYPDVAVMLRDQITIWHRHGKVLNTALDVEALHSLRVSARRMIAALTIVAQLHSAPDARKRRQQLRRLLKRTSAARDLDSHYMTIRDQSKNSRGADMSAVVLRLSRQRSAAHTRLVQLLSSAGTARLFRALDKIAVRELSPEPLLLCMGLRRLARKRFRGLRNAASVALRHPSQKNLHAMRIKCKNLRYLLEPFDAVYGLPLRAFVERLRRVQSLLGRINDGFAFEVMTKQLRRCRPALAQDAIEQLRDLTAHRQGRRRSTVAAVHRTWRHVLNTCWGDLKARLRQEVAVLTPAAR